MKTVLALLALATFAPAFADEAPRFACGGTEPFWHMYINSKQITLKSLSDEKSFEHKVVLPEAPLGQILGYNHIYQTKTLDKKTPATIVIQQGECSDGMSDTIYPYSVVYVSGENIYSGCCFKNN